jgi:hypothetical protein
LIQDGLNLESSTQVRDDQSEFLHHLLHRRKVSSFKLRTCLSHDLTRGVGTVKKSMATISPKWFRRKILQVCDGGRRIAQRVLFVFLVIEHQRSSLTAILVLQARPYTPRASMQRLENPRRAARDPIGIRAALGRSDRLDAPGLARRACRRDPGRLGVISNESCCCRGKLVDRSIELDEPTALQNIRLARNLPPIRVGFYRRRRPP